MASPDDSTSSHSDLENNKTDSTSTDRLTTPCPRPSLSKSQLSLIASIVSHNININYSHTYSITKKNGEELDFKSLPNSLI